MVKTSLRQLECLVTVAEEQSVARAARRLGMAQPPVSRLIHRLEAILGAPVFERAPRGMRLTAAGEAALGPARRAVTEARLAIESAQRAAKGDTGTLSVGFSSSAAFSVLPKLLRAYRRRYPDVHLELRERDTASLLSDVEEGLLDVVIARGIVVVTAQPRTAASSLAFPSSHPQVLAAHSSVEAVNSDSPYVLAAPAREVLTTTPGARYAFLTGNSLAAAHTTGVVALLMEREPDLDAERIAAILTASTTHSSRSTSINACRALAGRDAGALCAESPGSLQF